MTDLTSYVGEKFVIHWEKLRYDDRFMATTGQLEYWINNKATQGGTGKGGSIV